QSGFSLQSLREELSALCFNEAYRKQMLGDYEELALLVGGAGSSERTASAMWAALRNQEDALL
ncbi:MAG TPA: hypothetical protein GXZ39_10545, partial [Bacteroidales bacterium]|nr:hypothetical protein [Bacteroidales bacterium]